VDICQCVSEGIACLCYNTAVCLVIVILTTDWTKKYRVCVSCVVSLPRQFPGDIRGHVGFLCDKAAVFRKTINRETLCNESDRKKLQ